MNEDYPYRHIGRRIKRLRLYLGYGDSKSMAKAHDLGEGTYSHWETGRRRINLDSAIRLKELYGITLDWLYMGRSETLPQNLMKALSSKPLDKASNVSKDNPES